MSKRSNSVVRSLVLLGLGVVVLASCVSVIADNAGRGWIGSLDFPAPGYQRFVAVWMPIGSLAAALFAATFVCFTPPAGLVTLLSRVAGRISDRTWIACAMFAALLFPLLLRYVVLLDAPVTDDEGAYAYSAKLLGRGQLWLDLPAAPQHERQFMVNEGRYFSQYFLGWPALLAPFTLVGLADLANPVFAALTVPALYSVALRLSGRTTARLALLLYLTSPMLMFAASTHMAHTSCGAALMWAVWATLRSRDDSTRPWIHALVAGALCVAFFIRPATALGMGAPLVVFWGHGLAAKRIANPAKALVYFLAPVACGAAMFLLVNALQTGSPFVPAYDAYARHAGWTLPIHGAVHDGIETLGIALLRLNSAILGWPLTLPLALLAGFATHTYLLWAAFAGHLVVHMFARHVGVDTFGPAHFVEVSLPIIILLAVAAVRSTEHLRTAAPSVPQLSRIPMSLVAGFILVGLTTYWPGRARAIQSGNQHVRDILDAPSKQGVRHAAIFVPLHWIDACRIEQGHTWVFDRPLNDPDMSNDILWFRRTSAAADVAFAAQLQERSAWTIEWRMCEPLVVPVTNASEP